MDYLKNCHEYHENMVNSISIDDILIINSNIDSEKDTNINNIWINDIKEFIYKS